MLRAVQQLDVILTLPGENYTNRKYCGGLVLQASRSRRLLKKCGRIMPYVLLELRWRVPQHPEDRREAAAVRHLSPRAKRHQTSSAGARDA
jgi:hypothetical protein